MPQLDASTFGSQIFWLLASFIVLYLLMAYVALPRIGRALQTRADTKARDLEEAQNMQAEAQASLAQHEKQLEEARSRALKIAEDLRAEARAASEAERGKIEAELAQAAKTAEARLEAARTQALSGVGEAAAEIVPVVMGALSLPTPDDAAISAALKSAKGTTQ